MTVADLSVDAAVTRANEVARLIHENGELRESLAAVNRALALEDQTWERILGGSTADYEGIGLDELQEISEQIRQAMVKSPMVNRGAQLRHSYVWSKGINLPVLPAQKPHTGPKNEADRIHDRISSTTNQRYLLSSTAWEEMERAEYSDGNFFLLGDNDTREVRRVPLKEITNFITNPDFEEEVWAWQRTWDSTDRQGKREKMVVWYYADDCPALMKDRAKSQIQSAKVDHTKTFLVHSVNRMVGWPLGIPDAVAIIAWAKLYSEFLKYGYVMSRALASIAFRATSPTKAGAQKAAVQFAQPRSAGETVVTGSASGLEAMPTAGKGYDFASGRPIAAMVATGVQVSIVHLLSDPGAAGSSYGSASNLDLPTKRAVVSRQQSWVAFFVRVLKWLGMEDPKVSFPSLDEPDFYREVQSILLGWSTGLLHEDEVRARLLALLDIHTSKTEAPEGAMLPNNTKSILRGDIDGEPSNTSTASPSQGKNSPAGASGTDHVTRDDTIGESLRHLEVTELLRQVLAQLQALES
jgi:hypothetical protein